jgi:hypothetical protein
MHTNHRRKNKQKCHGRWWGRLVSYKQAYWRSARALERHLMSHERYDELQNRHPGTVLWDAC